MKKEQITYFHEKTKLEGYAAYEGEGKKPLILLFHAWTGRDEFACKKAEELAKLGYVGFAVDLFGPGKIGTTHEECGALMQPFVESRQFLRDRMYTAFEAAKKIAVVDQGKIGAIGFCFGGLSALDFARSGAPIKGVVSFHGLLEAPKGVSKEKILSKILVLHGHDDPMVSAESISQFQSEMTRAEVDWQMHIYGHAMHAFTNPKAHDPGFGTVYNSLADKRSWIEMKNFFSEIF
jgi:dienelactone hydrolase